MSTEVHAQIDSERVKELTAREAKRLEESTQESKRMYARASEVMPLGVPSSVGAAKWVPSRARSEMASTTAGWAWPMTIEP